ncbi:MAG: peptide chain release factor N(5)-glutamine methyltransferase [Sulfuriferula sp.]
MSSISQVLRQDQARLVRISGMASADARFEVHLLMAQALQVNRAWLLAHGDEMLPVAALASYQNWLEQRLQGEPIAYILGKKEFYGQLLTVNSAVLIPRPETELLVDLALACMPSAQRLNVLDLGTGSGAIALALAKWRPEAQLLAVDASTAALQVAQANAQDLQLDNIQFMESNWWQYVPVLPKFEVIVSNPPYIAADDRHLQQGDLRFEPLRALAAGATGLDDLQTIIKGAPDYLAAGGWLLLEHGFEQGAEMRKLLNEAGFSEVDTLRDLAGSERVSKGKLRPLTD